MIVLETNNLRARRVLAIAAALAAAAASAACTRSADGAGASKQDFARLAEARGGTTYDDYARAVSATIACMRDKGLEVKGPVESGAGRFLRYGYGVRHHSEEERARKEAEAEGIYRACYDAHEGRVVDDWIRASAGYPEDVERKTLELIDCLRDAGADLPIDPTLQDVNAALATTDGKGAYQCHFRYADYFVTASEDA